MKREILYRGKSPKGHWIYGMPSYDLNYIFNDSNYDSHDQFEIIPETVGQFTGLTDKNGVKIFEGDILLSESWSLSTRSKRKTHIVEWEKGKWLASGYNGEIKVKPSLDIKSDWQVIGNIHDK